MLQNVSRQQRVPRRRESRDVSFPGNSESGFCSIKLKAFKKFQDTQEALEAATSLIEGTSIDKTLKSFLKKVSLPEYDFGRWLNHRNSSELQGELR